MRKRWDCGNESKWMGVEKDDVRHHFGSSPTYTLYNQKAKV